MIPVLPNHIKIGDEAFYVRDLGSYINILDTKVESISIRKDYYRVNFIGTSKTMEFNMDGERLDDNKIWLSYQEAMQYVNDRKARMNVEF